MYDLFGSMVGYIGGACIIVAIMMGSVIPIVVGVVGLVTILGFMNGLGASDVKVRSRSGSRYKKVA